MKFYDGKSALVQFLLLISRQWARLPLACSLLFTLLSSAAFADPPETDQNAQHANRANMGQNIWFPPEMDTGNQAAHPLETGRITGKLPKLRASNAPPKLTIKSPKPYKGDNKRN
jgi:hypothetical protein